MTDLQLFANNAVGRLSSESLAADTTLNLYSAIPLDQNYTDSFPSPGAGQFALATLSDDTGTLIEIVKITSKLLNTLIVVRGQEGTTPRDWPEGTKVEMRITAQTMYDLRSYAVSSGALAGEGTGTLKYGVGAEAVGGPMAIGYNVKAWRGSARGGYVQNRVENTYMESGFPLIKMEDYDNEAEGRCNAPETVMCSPYVDLGVPPAWQANTVYHHGDIVLKPEGGLLQYRMIAPNVASPGDRALKQSVTSGSNQPNFPPWSGGLTADGVGHWTGTELTWEILMEYPPAGTVFVPTAMGFICHGTFSALTGTPVVSIGVFVDVPVSRNTQYVNAQNVNITSAHSVHLFTMESNLAVLESESQQLRIKLDTAATAGRCVGRFFVKGFFVELPNHS